MNGIHFPNDPAGVFQAIDLSEFGVTWAGPNPFQEGFCFGSETGQLRFTDAAGVGLFEIPQASKSAEAVNGVAFSQNWLVVTTRKDINLIGPCLPRTKLPDHVVFYGGGRDVAVAPTSGHFVIPLGPDGLMFLKPGASETEPVSISKSQDSELNFCRVIALPGQQGGDVLVCAGRRGGVGYAEYHEVMHGHTLHTVGFHDLDIVDVCSLATPENPRAVVAVAKDGALTFFRDILTDKTPQTVRFKRVTGTVYRVLSAQGDIYLLTSKGLFCLFGLGTRSLAGEPRHFVTEILRCPLEGADANLFGARWLVVAGTDAVFRFDLAKLPKSAHAKRQIANDGVLEFGDAETDAVIPNDPAKLPISAPAERQNVNNGVLEHGEYVLPLIRRKKAILQQSDETLVGAN